MTIVDKLMVEFDGSVGADPDKKPYVRRNFQRTLEYEFNALQDEVKRLQDREKAHTVSVTQRIEYWLLAQGLKAELEAAYSELRRQWQEKTYSVFDRAVWDRALKGHEQS